ncbi:hypothetical protein AVEN_235241-2-1, partial [Araneus ventricosus]
FLTFSIPTSTSAYSSKKEIIVLFHKNGIANFKTYRPVTLLPTIGKIFEKILLRSVNIHIKTNYLTHPNQLRFHESLSTDAVKPYTGHLHTPHTNNHTLVISSNSQEAFDHLQHSSIHNSIDALDFPSNTTETVKDILRFLDTTTRLLTRILHRPPVLELGR